MRLDTVGSIRPRATSIMVHQSQVAASSFVNGPQLSDREEPRNAMHGQGRGEGPEQLKFHFALFQQRSLFSHDKIELVHCIGSGSSKNRLDS